MWTSAKREICLLCNKGKNTLVKYSNFILRESILRKYKLYLLNL